ncbi:hypothetical protein PACILC2_52690 [Paenibacillus cisolokensis]|uniref:Uncharacterized protein n=1 Tax=Paenibacillus cisolokensis TaxID=1658519 RepID=A0ABQ4NEP6_9BACL|nr:hypothetical protein PACILC2_52690 [Paenibacillus cisolokensis]
MATGKINHYEGRIPSMSSGAEAADQVVNMSLRGIEVMAKISGEGAKHLAVYLFAALQGQKRTKGSIRLESLLRSGKELKVFAVKTKTCPRSARKPNDTAFCTAPCGTKRMSMACAM